MPHAPAALLFAALTACGPETSVPALPPAAIVAAAPAPAQPETAQSEPGKPATQTPSSEVAPPGAVVLNQHGFIQFGPKRAVWLSSGPAAAFEVRNSRGQAVLSGTTEPVPGVNPQSGTRVHRLDFSALRDPGSGYTVRVGDSVSDPFAIGRPYASLTRDSLNYFYQSRFGEAVEAAFVPAATPPLTRPAGHRDARYSCFAGADLRGTQWPGCDYVLAVRGGWYDAGDYGQYAVNTAAATWMMLDMAERAAKPDPRLCKAALGDRSLRLPEAGNGVPDIMDEARLGVENLLSLQVASAAPQPLARGAQPPTGPLRLTETDARGMVHHKVHGLAWASSDGTPADDTAPRRLYPPSTAATLSLAGIGAQCARVFRDVDAAFAAQCLVAARAAYAAAERVPDAFAWDVFDGGGPYDDQTLADEFGWAATELWLATGEAAFAAAMERHLPRFDPYTSFDWRSVEPRAVLSLARQPGEPTPRITAARLALRAWQERLVAEGASSHYGLPSDSGLFYWGSNGGLLDRAVILAAAHEHTGDALALRGVVDAADYVLGRNALSRSFVSGYGARPMRNPHHRFWRGGTDAARPLPPPGVLSGGPNNVNYIDPVGSTLRGQCAGMTCWRDDADAYSLNEVAINWNASLAWVAHWLDRQSASCQGPVRDTSDLD